MKSAVYILVFFTFFLSCVYAEEIFIYTQNEKSLLIANHVYPDFPKKKGTKKNGWFLAAKSEKSFKLNGSSYTVYSWNEINNPGVSTQMDHYNYGGMLVLKNNKFLLKFRAPNQIIKKVIIKGNCANIVALYSFVQRGNAEEYINVYRLKGNKLSNIFSRQTLESDLMSNGSYHMESDILFKDFNGDGISDLMIREKLYEVKDFEKTDRYSVKNNVKFIIKGCN